MSLTVINPADFLDSDILMQDHVIKRADGYDWSILKGKRVLVRGCHSAPTPAWAFM